MPFAYCRDPQSIEETSLGLIRSVLDSYALAMRNRDTDGIRQINQNIREFSRKYPSLAINANTIRRSMQSRQKFSERQVNGLSVNPKLARRLSDDVRFGAEEDSGDE